MTRVLRAITILSSFLLLFAAVEARAQDDDTDARARELYETGVTAYEEGRYEDAVESLQSAYELSPRPLLLFNLANAHERLGHHAEAVSALEGYLPHAQISERAQIETRIRNLHMRLDEEEAAAAAAAAQEEEGTTEEAPADFSGLMVPGVVLTAGGVGLVVWGIISGIIALDLRGQITGGDAPICADTTDGRLLCSGEANSRIADDELFALMADIGLIGGGVVTAVGAVLVILAVTSPGPDAEPGVDGEVVWMPDVRIGPSGASVGVVGSF